MQEQKSKEGTCTCQVSHLGFVEAERGNPFTAQWLNERNPSWPIARFMDGASLRAWLMLPRLRK